MTPRAEAAFDLDHQSPVDWRALVAPVVERPDLRLVPPLAETATPGVLIEQTAGEAGLDPRPTYERQVFHYSHDLERFNRFIETVKGAHDAATVGITGRRRIMDDLAGAMLAAEAASQAFDSEQFILF